MKRQNILRKKDGSALIIAVIIMLVVMMLSFALLLVSYSLHATAIKHSSTAQGQVLAQDVSLMMENQLNHMSQIDVELPPPLPEPDPPVEGYEPETSEERYARGYAETIRLELETNNEYPFWDYLRTNLNQASWHWVDETKGQFKKYKDGVLNTDVVRPFRVTLPSEMQDSVDSLTVNLYWHCRKPTEREQYIAGTLDKMELELETEVSAVVHNIENVVTTRYTVTIERLKPKYGDIKTTVSGNQITLNERWTFDVESRR